MVYTARLRYVVASAIATVAIGVPAASATVLAPAVIDTAPLQIDDIGVAPDGTGAMAYIKTVGTDDRVYASILGADGTWGPTQIIDTDTGDDETAARVAVGNGGRVLIGYLDGPALHYRLIPKTGDPLSAEGNIHVAANAAAIGPDWDLDMNAAGVAYAAWTDLNPGTMKIDARAWRLEGTTGAETFPLQQTPMTQGVDKTANGPDIRVAVDPAGNGGISFTENDSQAFFLRLIGTTPSTTYVNTLLPNALGEAISGTYHQHDLDIGKDGIAWESANAMYPNGGHVVGVPITGETAGTPVLLDPYPASENDNAERPDVALNEAGRGLFAAEPNQKAGVFGGTIDGATASAPQRLDISPMDGAAIEIPSAAIGDSGKGLIAWSRDVADGAAGPEEVRARLFDGATMAPDELLLSDPALGEGKIPLGVANADGAGASRLGDAAVLMEQDQGATQRVVVGRYDAPPSAPIGTTTEDQTTNARPALTWSKAEALWSPLTSYKVFVDDAVIGTVGADATTFTPATDIAVGDHTWRVSAVDSLGQETSSPSRALRIKSGGTVNPPGTDTTKPKITLSVKGKRRVGRKLTLRAKATDAGGVAKIALRLGSRKPRSRTAAKIVVRKKFTKRGKVKLRVTATDKAGNVARLKKTIKIKRKKR